LLKAETGLFCPGSGGRMVFPFTATCNPHSLLETSDSVTMLGFFFFFLIFPIYLQSVTSRVTIGKCFDA
jgi:hypothetical protein